MTTAVFKYTFSYKNYICPGLWCYYRIQEQCYTILYYYIYLVSLGTIGGDKTQNLQVYKAFCMQTAAFFFVTLNTSVKIEK